MGLFGGSAQGGTSSVNNAIDFMPVFNMGDSNSTSTDKRADQTSTVTPTLDDSFGMAASVAAGSGTSAAPATLSQNSPQPTQVGQLSSIPSFSGASSNMILIVGALGLGAVGLFLILKKKK
jgi:hypothetical protein